MNVKFYVRALLCLYLTTSLSSINAQTPETIKVGDVIPQELWTLPLQVINHPKNRETITLSEYKDKLIIIDFWATWCGPCIRMFPTQDSLQRQFEDRIQILPVTYQTVEEVKTFMAKYREQKGVHINLTEVVNNQSLKPYFQHATIPHYVWIKKGEIMAITGPEEIKAERIAAVINEDAISMKTKSQTPSLGYPSGRVSLIEFLAYSKPEYTGNFFYRSAMSRYIPGLSSEVNIIKPTEELPEWRITLTNVPLLRLYQFAYGEGAKFTNLATIANETSDSLHLMPSRTETDVTGWIRKNTYSYELVVPGTHVSEAFPIFRNQLTVIFPQYRTEIENRSVRVLALEKISQATLKISASPRLRQSFDGFTYEFTGGTLSQFVKSLNNKYLSHLSQAVVDMTGYEKKIDLILKVNPGDVAALNIALKEYGLTLTERVATIPVLVIKDRQTRLF